MGLFAPDLFRSFFLGFGVTALGIGGYLFSQTL